MQSLAQSCFFSIPHTSNTHFRKKRTKSAGHGGPEVEILSVSGDLPVKNFPSNLQNLGKSGKLNFFVLITRID